MQMPPLTEEKTKWTPGPWSHESVTASDEHRIVYCLIGPNSALKGKRGVAYAGTYGKTRELNTAGIRLSDEECEANARLIATAPDLYDACECAEAVISIVEPRSDKKEYLGCLAKLRAALAKARGDA
jgi:hypothetical protein